jgi:hypothetical protein
VKADTPRGSILLEVLLAIAIFVAAGIATLRVADMATNAASRTALRAKAEDLARSAMAKLEAGVATSETLSGPVKPESDDETLSPEDEGWEIEIETEPSRFAELTHVTVRVIRRTGERETPELTHELHQLVRLVRRVDDAPGVDPLTNMAAGGGATP